ncbi:Patatin, partial [Mesorhizobium sp. M7A.T.Ca.TU.009.01.3.2]
MLEWASLRNRPDVREANGLSSSGGASETNTQKKTAISLALGGGCARGWAHIGVLRALDEAGIEVSMIAGTSIGALVGGCYLAGKLDELEEFARSLTKRRIFGLLDLNLRGSGLFGGMKLDARLREHMAGIRFEDLAKPFVAVTSEIRTGHEIWLSSGSLITAMRASYALPGVFEPVNCNGRVLVD